MLSELRVRELGVIEDVDIVLAPGLTAITGETGAGKTLVVEALELLVGGRADGAVVRAGAEEASVEARFVGGEDEVVLSRVVPRSGRARGAIDGKMATLAALEESGRELVDLYGQHGHQSLLRPLVQRASLDRYAGVDLEPVRRLRREIGALDAELASIGGDNRERGRELDRLRYEREEIDAAGISAPDEDERLADEEKLLAEATALQESALSVHAALESTDGTGIVDRLGALEAELDRHGPLGPVARRLHGVGAELADVSVELRLGAERFEEDPERLEEVRLRRRRLHDLMRKHGETLADVLAEGARIEERIAAIESADARRGELEERRATALVELGVAEGRVGDARRSASGRLAAEVERHLRRLGMARARLEVAVGEEGIGDDVEFLLAANPGEDALALAKVASGGELARAMLALRLVLTTAPPTLVFDEVDAGIGGRAALAVGRALAELGANHQVLVVTHLAPVAAYAEHQLVVDKRETAGRTIADVRPVDGEDRVGEISRMLSGDASSETARRHAAELLESVQARAAG